MNKNLRFHKEHFSEMEKTKKGTMNGRFPF